MRWELLAQVRSPDDGFWDTLVVLSLTEEQTETTEAPARERAARRRPSRPSSVEPPSGPEQRPSVP
jgi:hypothetical protein